MKPRVLVTRTDRLGDVLLSLPAVAEVRRSLGPEYLVDFMVGEPLVPLLEPFLESMDIGVIPYVATSNAWWNAIDLPLPVGAVSLFHDEPVARALKASKVPLRVGLYSKLSSFFLYNHGCLQRRSRADRSEGAYAQELATVLIEKLGKRAIEPGPLELPARADVWAKVSEKCKLDAPYWVLHPGMGGSAQNLSVEGYAHLSRLVAELRPDLRLIISKGPAPADARFDALKDHVDGELVAGLSLVEFSELLRHASLVVAPSTGPLHLAHWVGAETLGLFSCVRPQWASRWAPRGGTGISHVWSPDAPCGGRRKCSHASTVKPSCIEAGVLKWDLAFLKSLLLKNS